MSVGADEQGGDEARPAWTFLTNHAHVLVCIARDPLVRQRDIARMVGITERAAQKIVAELERGGYLLRERVGRRNRYSVDGRIPLRHPLEEDHTVGELLELLTPVVGQPLRRRAPASTARSTRSARQAVPPPGGQAALPS